MCLHYQELGGKSLKAYIDAGYEDGAVTHSTAARVARLGKGVCKQCRSGFERVLGEDFCSELCEVTWDGVRAVRAAERYTPKYGRRG